MKLPGAFVCRRSGNRSASVWGGGEALVYGADGSSASNGKLRVVAKIRAGYAARIALLRWVAHLEINLSAWVMAGVTLDRGVDLSRAAERFGMIVHSERNRSAWVHDGFCTRRWPRSVGFGLRRGGLFRRLTGSRV